MILTASMLFAPALAMGIAQQDPQQQPAAPQQQLQQSPSTAAQGNQEIVGTIVEVRDDSFSVRKDSDQSTVWFTITPDLKQSASAELVTGNHVRVMAMPGASADRWAASSVTAEAGGTNTASADIDKDTDIDADVKVDNDSATATIDRDTEYDRDNDQVAKNELNQDDDADVSSDNDELPRTASSLPEIGALGLLALLGAAAVAFVRKA
jgi:hypothetical protein